MRADRLVALVLLLRRRGRLSAETLARELEVSTRTVLRDIEALIKTRIPVVTDHPWHSGASAPPRPLMRAKARTMPPRTSSTRSPERSKPLRQAGGGHSAARENREHAGFRPR